MAILWSGRLQRRIGVNPEGDEQRVDRPALLSLGRPRGGFCYGTNASNVEPGPEPKDGAEVECAGQPEDAPERLTLPGAERLRRRFPRYALQ
jgi:hypothetical protein